MTASATDATYRQHDMKSIRLFLATLTAAVCVSSGAFAQQHVVKAFTSAPATVFPLIDNSARLDMLDYFNSTKNLGSTNALSGRSRITEIKPGSMRIGMTSASTYQIAALPAGTDTLTAVISTVLTPAPDSKMAVYTGNWATVLTDKVFSRPVLKDWLTPEGSKKPDEVELLVPFLLISYDFDPSTLTLTLTNNTSSFLSEEVYEIVSPYLRQQLRFVWNGKKFAAVR